MARRRPETRPDPPARAERLRLDRLVHERGLADSREVAARLVMAGRIRVDDRPADKPGRTYPADARVERIGEISPYVGRGGEKLAAALARFLVPMPEGDAISLDVGASTGGFTDCLLQTGAPRVVAVDTGRGRIHARLRDDPRVELLENFNARHLDREALGGRLAALAVVDVSFISLRLILPALAGVLAPGGRVVALVKPQFEAGRRDVGSGGIVRDAAVHRRVLEELSAHATTEGWRVRGAMASPLLGGKGNLEFFLDLDRPGATEPGADAKGDAEALARWIEDALREGEALRAGRTSAGGDEA